MSGNDATRFFDTSGCLNLSRPTTGTVTRATPRKRSTSSSIPTRGQLKIDLYNFDHIDFCDSKYVLTSPRSLEACARLNIKPVILLPKRLADVQDDIGTEKVRLATLADVRDQMEIDRLANLQRCREEREKIIREEALANPSLAKTPVPQPSYVHDTSLPRPAYIETKFTPSSSLLHGLNEPITVSSVPLRSESASSVKFSQLPPRSASSTRLTAANSILKSSTTQWPPSNEIDNQNEFHPSSNASLTDDVRRMNRSLQRMSTSEYGPRENKNERYINGLENVKQMIERRATHSATFTDPEIAAFEKKQYDILLGHYDHELKIQKARENARRSEKLKEIERYESLIHDLTDHSMAEERRQNELRRKIGKLHHSRQLYETLHAKNYEQQLADLSQRRLELLHDIQQKDRRTRHFVKDKEYAINLSRSLAKSSQDLRDYLRETHENFDEMARKAEFTSNVLVKKSKVPPQRRHLQSSIRT